MHDNHKRNMTLIGLLFGAWVLLGIFYYVQHQPKTQPSSALVIPARQDSLVNASPQQPTSSPLPTSTPRVALDAKSEKKLEMQLAEIRAEVAKLWGQPFKQDVAVYFVTAAQIFAKAQESSNPDNSGGSMSAGTEALLKFMELIPATYNLDQAMAKLLTEQIEGLYVPTEKALYVVAKSGDLNLLDRTVIAHEYTHTLQDQYFDLGAILQNKTNDDTFMAQDAVVEGDATEVMTEYVQDEYLQKKVSLGDLASVVTSASGLSQQELNSSPAIIQKSLLFPYEAGATFVTSRLSSGNDSWRTDMFTRLPTTTTQLLHQTPYTSNAKPMAVKLGDLSSKLGVGWHLVTENVMGEATWQMIFAYDMSATAATKSADGWDGDWYQYYENAKGEGIFVTRTDWETLLDATEFVVGLNVYSNHLKSSHDITTNTNNKRVDFILAKTPANMTLMQKALGE